MIPYSHNGSQFKASESDAMLTLTKTTMHNFTHSFTHIFQSIFASAHSRSQRSFESCNGAERKGFHFSQHHGLNETFFALLDFPLSVHHTHNLGFWPKLAIQSTTNQEDYR
ncbi:hypothetical protein H5410_027680 [Solanum commersonii]|uniref:Uncharacterized protein n=1 Tax=Solanum commersonii TaxID=4109 RepID=A0A9J5Z421_SOLCO|nr:hypothetical protein H5410_027680 [Solanum commersonii]